MLLWLAFAQWCYGQDPYYYHIDKSKGLPSNSVYDIFQDSTGYMWFATDEGLCRYNGTTFKTYYSAQQTSRSGSCIQQDKYGRIWYSNFDGYLYYVANGELRALKNQKPKGYFRYGIINDYLYILDKNGVLIYHLKTLKQVAHLNIVDEFISSTNVINGKFYIRGSVLYEIGDGKLLRKIALPSVFNTNLMQPAIMEATSQGILFVAKLSNTNYLLNAKGQFEMQHRPTTVNFVQNTAYTANNLWLCTSKGAHLYQSDNTYTSYFSAHNISCVFKDNKGNHWFSTLNRGLFLVPDLKNTLLQLQSRPITINAVKNGVVASTESGDIYEVNLNKNYAKLLYASGDNHAISQLLVDTVKDNIIFTSKKFNILNKKYQPQIQVHVAVKDVKPIDDTYYSFAASGYSGIFKLPANNQKSRWDSVYLAKKRKPNSENNFGEADLMMGVNGKATVYNSYNQTIYYATNVGLFYKMLDTQSEIKYLNNSLYIKKLQVYGNTVYGLATNGKLFAINVQNQPQELQLNNDGKLNFASNIRVIGNMLYIIASSAIYEYSLSTKQIINIMPLGSDFEVSDLSLYADKLVFATAKGILLQSRKIRHAKNTSPLVIEDIAVNDSLLNIDQLQHLKYGQNNVAIGYSLLAFTPQEKNPIYYRLNGGKWQQLVDYSGSLKLTSLAPGSYTISFSQLADGERPQSLSFTIAKPFWQATVFIFGVTTLFLLLIYVIYRYQIAQNNKQNQLKLSRLNLEKNLNLSKLKAIKSQMNPHFFYNALNTIQSYILDSDKKQAVGYLSKFSALTRTILEMSENEYINLNEEIKMIGFYLDIEKARFSDGFEYTIDLRHIATDEDIRIPSLLLQPYVENAIKHGLLHKQGDKKLNISFEKTNQILRVTIDDNGIGRQRSAELNRIKSQKPQSFATEAIQNRIDLLNEGRNEKITVQYIDKISVADNPLGTTVVIEIPLN